MVEYMEAKNFSEQHWNCVSYLLCLRIERTQKLEIVWKRLKRRRFTYTDCPVLFRMTVPAVGEADAAGRQSCSWSVPFHPTIDVSMT